MSSSTIPVVTVDGPASSGKGTISRLVVQELGWHFLDSGVFYRIVGFIALQRNYNLADEAKVAEIARNLDVKFVAENGDETAQVLFEGEDISKAIRSEAAGKAASMVSALSKVRTELLDFQRDFRQSPGLITDGRDMGTVVFPDAQLKIYLDASQSERANRRYAQLKTKGIDVTLERIMVDLIARDKRDQERAIAPLKAASDAFILDTTGMKVEEVVSSVITEIQKLQLG